MNNMNTKQMPRIMIFGANGQVGYALLSCLHTFANVIPITRFELDISNLLELSNFFHNLFQKPDIIINASAYTAVDKAEQEQELCNIINNCAVEIMAVYCKENNIPFIHYSTDYVFDGKNNGYNEDDVTNPINYYGYTKLLGENAIRDINPIHFIFRTSWVYDYCRSNFVSTMLILAKTRNELNVVNDQFGSPTWSVTIANITSYIIKDFILEKDTDFLVNCSGIYNLVASGHTNWCDYAKTIFKYMHKNVEVIGIPTVEYPNPAKRPQYSILYTQKIHKTFNVVVPTWEYALQCCLRNINC
ncbi:MAG: dTDP-4-dehydrorhamnose reductase [Pseudomonadota bacterium]